MEFASSYFNPEETESIGNDEIAENSTGEDTDTNGVQSDGKD